MQITLAEIERPNCCETPELQRRARESTKSVKTIWYRAISDDREVAFVALDRWKELDHVVLYELFVPQRLRGQGFGTAVLREVECAARLEGFSNVRVCPRPLTSDINLEDLTKWYRQRGYQADPTVPSEMVKCVLGASQ